MLATVVSSNEPDETTAAGVLRRILDRTGLPEVLVSEHDILAKLDAPKKAAKGKK